MGVATSRRRLASVPIEASAPTWAGACDVFLRRDLSPGSRRVYGLTLARLGQEIGPEVHLEQVTARQVAAALHASYPDAAPATWNRHVGTVNSFSTFIQRQGWSAEDLTRAVERRHVPEDHSRALDRQVLDDLFTQRKISTRDRCLWRMLYETAARAEEVLQLNVEDLNLAARRATTIRKGGATDVIHWATGTARLLPKVIDGRTSGPLFVSGRAIVPTRAPAKDDIDPTTGRARLSYRRAAEVFNKATGGATLHQLRHSALTHYAEDGVDTVMLMAKSRHASLRTLQRYARPSVEAVARMTAEHDPARRR